MNYKSNIWKLNFFVVLSNFFLISGIMIPFFLDWGKITFMQVMILEACFMIFITLLEVPTGAFADHYGRKKSIAIGSFAVAVAALVYSSMPNFWVFLCGEFLWAIGVAFTSGADESLLYDSLKQLRKERLFKKKVGGYESFRLVGIMLSAPLGSAIAAVSSLQYPMLFMVIPLVCAALLALTMKEPQITTKKQKTVYLKTMKAGIAYFRNHPTLSILTFDTVSVTALCFTIVWIYQLVLSDLNVPITYFGLVCAAMTAAGIPVLNNFEKLEQLFGSRMRYIRASAILAAVCFAVLGLTKSVFVAVSMFILIEAFGITRGTLFGNYMHKHIESRTRSTVMSAIYMIQTLVQALIYLVLGLLVKWSLKGTFFVIAGLILLSVLFSSVEEKHLLD